MADQDKLTVNYRISESDQERCQNCVNFKPPNACGIVEGEISEDGVCDLFEPSGDALMATLFDGGGLPQAGGGGLPGLGGIL